MKGKLKFNSINEAWISDKTRFFYDGLKIGRLKNSLIKTNFKKNNFLGWKKIMNLLGNVLKNVS